MSLPSARQVLLVIVVFVVAPATCAQTNPTPFLYPLTPSATAPGGEEFTLTVNGAGFVSGAMVNWNGGARTTTFVSSSQVTAMITAADIPKAGTAVITVTNPGPGGGTSNAEYFQVTNATVGLVFQDSPPSIGVYQPKVLAGDVNGDGKPDLVVWGFDTTANNFAIHVLIGNGDGTFQAPMTTFPTPGANVRDLALGDVNGDGKADLIGFFNTPQTSGTFVLLGNGDGTFQAPVTSDVKQTYESSYMTLIADVNGDGKPDLVRASTMGVTVELGNGDGTFHQQFTYTPTNSAGRLLLVRSVTLGDFHKNGRLDIVAAVEPYYVVMLAGNGDGTFSAPSLVYGADAILTDSVVTADFDGDGNLDLAVYYANAAHAPPPAPVGALDILRGNGDGTFQAPITLAGLTESNLPSVLVAGDFDGDGHIDLAVQNEVILIGNGNGPFSYRVISTPNFGDFVTAAADFNGDGRLDLAGIDVFNSNLVHLLLQTPPPQDFRGAVNSTYQSVVTGNTASYEITITAINGFAGEVVLSATGLPEGATATFWPKTVTGSGSTTLKISTTAATPTGSYPITLTGTSGNLVHSGGVTLSVGPAGTNFADFTGSVQPSYQTIQPGGNTRFSIEIDPLYGFASDVSLSVSGLPPGGTPAFNPSVVAGGSGPTVLTVSVPSSTPTGTYLVTITGTGGGRTHNNTVALNVGPPGMDFTDFTGSVTPLARTVTVGGSTTFTVNIQPLYGTGCITLQTLAVPAATGAAYDRTTPICGGPASTVLTITTTPQTPVGTYTITLLGLASGGNTHSKNITLTVTPP